jgi:hypothetical protein
VTTKTERIERGRRKGRKEVKEGRNKRSEGSIVFSQKSASIGIIGYGTFVTFNLSHLLEVLTEQKLFCTEVSNSSKCCL